MPLVQDEDVVEAFPADRADRPLAMRVGLRRQLRRPDDTDTRASCDVVKAPAKLAVVIANQELRRQARRREVTQVLRQPARGRLGRRRRQQQPPCFETAFVLLRARRYRWPTVRRSPVSLETRVELDGTVECSADRRRPIRHMSISRVLSRRLLPLALSALLACTRASPSYRRRSAIRVCAERPTLPGSHPVGRTRPYSTPGDATHRPLRFARRSRRQCSSRIAAAMEGHTGWRARRGRMRGIALAIVRCPSISNRITGLRSENSDGEGAEQTPCSASGRDRGRVASKEPFREIYLVPAGQLRFVSSVVNACSSGCIAGLR